MPVFVGPENCPALLFGTRKIPTTAFRLSLSVLDVLGLYFKEGNVTLKGWGPATTRKAEKKNQIFRVVLQRTKVPYRLPIFERHADDVVSKTMCWICLPLVQ